MLMTVETAQEQNEINLLDYVEIIWRRKLLLFSICAVSVIITMIVSLMLPKYYRSEVMFLSTSSESGGLGSALSALPLASALGGAAGIQTPSDKVMLILKSRTTAEMIVKRFDLLRVFNEGKWDAGKGAWKKPDEPPLVEDAIRELNRDVSTFSKNKEGAIVVGVKWKDPVLAANIANYYVSALTGFLNEKAINITIQVVDKAVPAERKYSPKISQNMMIAAMFSLILGSITVIIHEYREKLEKKDQ